MAGDILCELDMEVLLTLPGKYSAWSHNMDMYHLHENMNHMSIATVYRIKHAN